MGKPIDRQAVIDRQIRQDLLQQPDERALRFGHTRRVQRGARGDDAGWAFRAVQAVIQYFHRTHTVTIQEHRQAWVAFFGKVYGVGYILHQAFRGVDHASFPA